MANPRKITRPFRNPGDVERMWKRLARSGPDWKDASPIDKAAFLQAMSPAYAAYDVFKTLEIEHITQDWFQVRPFPQGAALNTQPGGAGAGIPQERFWSSPVFAESTRQPGTPPNPEFLSGWYFLPKDITLEFFNPTTPNWVRILGHVQLIRTPNIDSGDAQPAGTVNQPYRWNVIGCSPFEQDTFIKLFSTHGGSANETGEGNDDWHIAPGWLRDFPLLPNATLFLQGLNGLVEGRVVHFIMTGEWHFSPYFMEPGEEADR